MESLTKKPDVIESRNIVFFPAFDRMNSFILNLGIRVFPLFSTIPHNPYHNTACRFSFVYEKIVHVPKRGSRIIKSQKKRPIVTVMINF